MVMVTSPRRSGVGVIVSERSPPDPPRVMFAFGTSAGSDDDAASLRPFRWGTFETPPQVNPLVVAPVRGTESASGQYISVIDKDQPQTDLVMDFVMFWLSAPGYQTSVDGAAAANQFIPAGRIMVRGVQIPGHLAELFEIEDVVGAVDDQGIRRQEPHELVNVSVDGQRFKEKARKKAFK